MSQPTDYRGKAIPLLGGKSVDNITTSATSQSSALTTGAIRVVCTEDCYYLVGKNLTVSSSNGIFLPANVVETAPVLVPGDMNVYVIRSTTNGIFNITSLRT